MEKPLIKVSPNHRLIKYAWEIYVIDECVLYFGAHLYREASNFLLIYLILI